MSIYQLWYAIAEHFFNGVTCTETLELFSIIATTWTVLGFAMLPLKLMRGGRK